jgi:hypothetical protein
MIIARMSIQVTSCVWFTTTRANSPSRMAMTSSLLGLRSRVMEDRVLVLLSSFLAGAMKTLRIDFHFFRLVDEVVRLLQQGSRPSRKQGSYRKVPIITGPVTDGILSCLSPVSSKKRHTHVSAHLADWSVNDTGKSEQRLLFLCDSLFPICWWARDSRHAWFWLTQKSSLLRKMFAYKHVIDVRWHTNGSKLYNTVPAPQPVTWHLQLYMLATCCRMSKVKARCNCVVASRKKTPF